MQSEIDKQIREDIRRDILNIQDISNSTELLARKLILEEKIAMAREELKKVNEVILKGKEKETTKSLANFVKRHKLIRIIKKFQIDLLNTEIKMQEMFIRSEMQAYNIHNKIINCFGQEGEY